MKKSNEQKRLEAYGQSLIGKSAQSTILTMISNDGQRAIPEPSKKITSYEIVETFQEPTLMVSVGGDMVFESTLFNIH